MRQRYQVFDSFITTVGTNGTLTFPLRDAANASITTLRVGPGFRRNPIRFFAKMPTKEESIKLPAPLTSDRDSVTFEPIMLYIGGPLPPHGTAKFSRILGGDHRGKINKHPLHRWQPQEDTTIYPASSIEIPSLRPGENIEFEGVSWWWNTQEPRRGTRREQPHPFAFPLPPEPPPNVAMMMPVNLMLLVRMKWLPKEIAKKHFRVVKGSPVSWTQTPMPMNPEAPAPDIPEPAQERSGPDFPPARTEEDP